MNELVAYFTPDAWSVTPAAAHAWWRDSGLDHHGQVFWGGLLASARNEAVDRLNAAEWRPIDLLRLLQLYPETNRAAVSNVLNATTAVPDVFAFALAVLVGAPGPGDRPPAAPRLIRTPSPQEALFTGTRCVLAQCLAVASPKTGSGRNGWRTVPLIHAGRFALLWALLRPDHRRRQWLGECERLQSLAHRDPETGRRAAYLGDATERTPIGVLLGEVFEDAARNPCVPADQRPRLHALRAGPFRERLKELVLAFNGVERAWRYAVLPLEPLLASLEGGGVCVDEPPPKGR